MSTAPAVYAAIAACMADLARDGIQKSRRNQQQGYQFRGVDDIYNALAPCLSRHRLVILPRVISRECTERQSAKGGVLFYVVAEVEFDFISAEDGSRHTVRTVGEAMDSADKATNKAMSAAYKYACLQTFCIPTEGDNDADAHTPTPAPAAAWADTIMGAVTMDELKSIYDAAIRATRDQADRARIVEAKELRKAQLSPVPA